MEANIGNEIDQFLSARGEYNTGLNLLMQFHRNRILIAHLIRRESDSNYEKIRYELEKYLKTINYERQEQRTTNPTAESETKESFHDHAGKQNERIPVRKVVDDSETNVGDISTGSDSFNHNGDYQRNILNKIFSDKEKLLYAERAQYHAQLKITVELQKRKELCFQILAAQSELDKIHSKQEALERDLLPVEDAVSQMDAKTYRTYKNKVSYISKFNAELKTCKDAERIEIINKTIAKHQTWINQLFKS